MGPETLRQEPHTVPSVPGPCPEGSVDPCPPSQPGLPAFEWELLRVSGRSWFIYSQLITLNCKQSVCFSSADNYPLVNISLKYLQHLAMPQPRSFKTHTLSQEKDRHPARLLPFRSRRTAGEGRCRPGRSRGGGAGSGEPPEELPSSATARSTRLARAKVRGSHPLRGAAAVRAAGTCRPFPSAAGPAGALLPLLVPRPGLPPAPGAPQLFEPSHPELLSRSCSSKLGSPAVPTAGRGQLPAARQPLGGAGASQLRGAPLLGTARDPVKPQGESCHVSHNMPCTAEGAGP